MCRINGRKLGEIREIAGMSQRELAEKIGVSAGTISHYENGDTNPSDENVEKICMVLKVNKDDVEIKNIDYSFESGESKTVNNARKQLGNKRYRKPRETEKFILENRVKSEKQELVSVESKLEQPTSFAGKKYIQIDPTLIHIPTWQRNTDFAKAEEINVNYDPNKYDPVKVYVKNGKLYVADGAHRLIGLILRNIRLEKRLMIVVEILDCSEDEAIRIFLSQKSGRKNMSTDDMYRAAIENGEENYLSFKRVCEGNKIQITAEEREIENPLGKIKPTGGMLRIAKNEALMNRIINLLKELNWTGTGKNAFVSRNFSVIKKLYSNFSADYVETKLMENCKGAVYYESKLFPVKSNSEMYDILAEEIRRK